jgi:hypothetical protein
MKYLIILALVVLGTTFAGCQPTKVAERNYAYEAYCDSIWAVDKDYYLDVLVETDEYQDYLEHHGEWWHD